MTRSLAPRPPLRAERLLHRILRPEDRAPVVRDLSELFDLHARNRGRRRAAVWYWWQVAHFAVRQPLERLRAGSGDPRSRSRAALARRSLQETVVNSTAQDIRCAVRSLARSPGFALVAIVTLGLGIGASTAVFSVVNGILLRPLPYPDSDRLVELFRTEDGEQRDNHSGANYLDIKNRSRSYSVLAGYRDMNYTIAGNSAPELVRGASVTSDFFDVFGVDAALGRTLSIGIDVPGSDPVVVLSHATWQSRFGGDPAVVGQELRANDLSHTIVGVMPPGFEFPDDVLFWCSSPYAVPESPVGDTGRNPETLRNLSWFSVLGRLADGVTLDEAQAEVTVIAAGIMEENPETHPGSIVVPLRDSMVGEVKNSLLILLGAVGFLMLIACANVANLLLVRSSAREREIAVRVALGAGRVRIVRQLATESMVLALAGGAMGLLVAVWGTGALLALAPDSIPRVAEVGTDLRVLVFTLLTAVVTGGLFGLAPAVRAFSLGSDRSATLGGSRHTSGRNRNRLRYSLIVSEVAVSLLLLVGAGLMVRTLVTLNQVNPGFKPENVLTARVWIPANRYSEDEDIIPFYRETLERVNAIPGVRSAGAVLSLPINAGINGSFGFTIEGYATPDGEDDPVAGFQVASADYLDAIGIPLVSGRWFSAGDDAEAPDVAVINQALADRYWPDSDPLGRRLTFGDPENPDNEWATIVGVVGNTRHFGLDAPPRPELYIPYLQGALNYLTLVVKSDVDPVTLTSAIRRAVMEVDPEQPVSEVATMDQVVFESLGSRRFNMLLLLVFAVTAVVLAAIGLYGVLSYSVSQRSNEIGIRMALGASAMGIIGVVMREGVGLTLIGLAAGAAGALALTRLMGSMVQGISASDPATYVTGASVLFAIAVAACSVPAFRASRVDPVKSLRQE